eukprot:364914-Chlamydomonas_euryale.AAC.12
MDSSVDGAHTVNGGTSLAVAVFRLLISKLPGHTKLIPWADIRAAAAARALGRPGGTLFKSCSVGIQEAPTA